MPEIRESFRGVERLRNIHCPLVGAVSCHDGNAVPFPGSPGVDGALADEGAIDDGLEGPAKTGIVFVEYSSGSCCDDALGLRTKAGGDGLLRNVGAADF